MMAVLETQNVSKVFRLGRKGEVWALKDVSLAIAPGSFSVLAGPSGSGKTTLLALLGALEIPTHGRVLFRGDDLSSLSDFERARARRRMGFIFQNFSLIARLESWQNITYPLIPRGMPAAKRYEIAQGLLSRLDLAGRIAMRPEEMSGGEQQRIAIARALCASPEVLLADEPTTNLDRRSRDTLLNILEELHAAGATLVISSHDPDVLRRATAVYELDLGRLREA